MTAEWDLVHEECPSADVNIEAWHQNGLIFVRNDQGLMYHVYSCMEDAVENNTDFALASVCYGWYNMKWERGGKKAHDDFLTACDRLSINFNHIPIRCHENAGECEDAYHAAQVLLDNEECDGCDRCRNAVIAMGN